MGPVMMTPVPATQKDAHGQADQYEQQYTSESQSDYAAQKAESANP
jgi:hypothetical protein